MEEMTNVDVMLKVGRRMDCPHLGYCLVMVMFSFAFLALLIPSMISWILSSWYWHIQNVNGHLNCLKSWHLYWSCRLCCVLTHSTPYLGWFMFSLCWNVNYYSCILHTAHWTKVVLAWHGACPPSTVYLTSVWCVCVWLAHSPLCLYASCCFTFYALAPSLC